MKHTIPSTPFSTPLSGSARTTELRIKNIISGPKKRPPVLFLALVFSVCLLCGLPKIISTLEQTVFNSFW